MSAGSGAGVRLPVGPAGISKKMLVDGVELSASAAACLALLLERAHHHDLAQRVGLAVDANSAGVRIRRDEESTLLAVLEDPPAQLRELRDALLRQPRSLRGADAARKGSNA